jgi:hypothetical protein
MRIASSLRDRAGIYLSPLGGEARLFRQSIVEQYRELLGFQRMQGRARRLRPPVKATFRETFQAEPISLPIVNEQLERCAGAITEDEESSGDRVLIEARFAEGDERINPLAKVDGFVSEQDIELRYNLDHQCQKRRKSARSRLMKTRSRDGSVNVSLDPSGRSI